MRPKNAQKWPSMAPDRVKNGSKKVKKKGQKVTKKNRSEVMQTFIKVHKKHSKYTQDASRRTHLLHTFIGWNVDFDRFFKQNVDFDRFLSKTGGF